MSVKIFESDLVDIKIVDGSIVRIKPNFSSEEPVTIRIPSVFDGQKIEAIGDGSTSICASFSRLTNVSIVIDDSISKIYSHAFSGVKLNKLHWPSACTEIPSCCFEGSQIKVLEGIDNVKVIGVRSFCKFTGMEKIIIPKACTEIKKCAFEYSEIETVSGGENVEVVEKLAFSWCKLKSISWFPKATTIPDGAFCNSNLEEITGIENVTEIKVIAFSGCELRKFIWPDNCPFIPDDCFRLCLNLTSVKNTDSVVKIGKNAFTYCKSLSDFEFLESLQTIEYEAFSRTGFSVIDLSGTMVESISKRAFAKCKNLEEFVPSIYCSYVHDEAFNETKIQLNGKR